MKRILAGLLAVLTLTASTEVFPQQTSWKNTVTVCAAEQAAAANPVISRGVPACSGGGTASNGNDDAYWTEWQSDAPDYLAYDLSGVPASQRKQVIAVWYNGSTYDSIGQYVSRWTPGIGQILSIDGYKWECPALAGHVFCKCL